jgi:hypothetical protein
VPHDSSLEQFQDEELPPFENLQAIFDADDLGLLEAPRKSHIAAPRDRLEQSFLEIVEFVEKQGREPSASTTEVSERTLGARLEGIRMDPEKVEALAALDKWGLLASVDGPSSIGELLNDDQSGLLDDPLGVLDTSELPKLRRRQQAAESVARREKCQDFARFQPLFAQKQVELTRGASKLAPFAGRRTIKEGEFFVLNGVMLFVAEIGEASVKVVGGKPESRERLRVIFENGTESSMYLKSLSIRLYEGGECFRVVPGGYETIIAEDEATGWVYVLKSLSEDPAIAARKNLYKIGFTTKSVAQRIAKASREPTYLMAPVEVVAEYRTYNVKASALEHLLHRVFADSRLDVSQVGFDGRTYDSTEWFEVPLGVIDQAVDLIMTGEIVNFLYDAVTNSFVPINVQ